LFFKKIIELINFFTECEEFNEPKTSVRSNHASQINQFQGNFGKPDIQFIVGGIKAYPEEFPHMSAIGIRRNSNHTDWICGGSLISEKFVLSAAHCALFGRKKPDVIRIGDQDLLSVHLGVFPQEFGVKNIIVHPQYKANLKYHDLALFELSTAAQ
jgi:secreted trypsin-like serine protease